MTDLDLFGEKLHEKPLSPVTGTKKRTETARGYAARPGSGPEQETCGTCAHCCHVAGGGSKFYKCAIIKHRWTGGPGTDIRLKSPACSHFAKFVPPEPPAGYRWVKFGESFAVGDRWLMPILRKPGEPFTLDEPLAEKDRPPHGSVGRRLPKDCLYCVVRPV